MLRVSWRVQPEKIYLTLAVGGTRLYTALNTMTYRLNKRSREVAVRGLRLHTMSTSFVRWLHIHTEIELRQILALGYLFVTLRTHTGHCNHCVVVSQPVAKTPLVYSISKAYTPSNWLSRQFFRRNGVWKKHFSSRWMNLVPQECGLSTGQNLELATGLYTQSTALKNITV